MKNEFTQILDNIKEMLSRADEIFSENPNLGSEYDIPEQLVENYIKESFINTLFLFEELKRNNTYEQLNNIYLKAQKDGFLKKRWFDDGFYLVWPVELRSYLSLIKPSISDKKKLRPNQKAKIKCREIAKIIWNKDPSITIADMINHPEILPHTKKRDGNYYVEKTIHNWIKDLCPDRSPGRKPKQKKGN